MPYQYGEPFPRSIRTIMPNLGHDIHPYRILSSLLGVKCRRCMNVRIPPGRPLVLGSDAVGRRTTEPRWPKLA